MVDTVQPIKRKPGRPKGSKGRGHGITYLAIKRLRQRMNLSQEEFARLIPVADKTVVCHWERRDVRPQKWVVKRIREIEKEWKVQERVLARAKLDKVRLVKRHNFILPPGRRDTNEEKLR